MEGKDPVIIQNCWFHIFIESLELVLDVIDPPTVLSGEKLLPQEVMVLRIESDARMFISMLFNMPVEEEHSQLITKVSRVEQMARVQKVEETADDTENYMPDPPL